MTTGPKHDSQHRADYLGLK